MPETLLGEAGMDRHPRNRHEATRNQATRMVDLRKTPKGGTESTEESQYVYECGDLPLSP